MNAIVNRLLLARDKFMPKMHARNLKPFTKNKERVKKIKEIRDSRYIYQNELDKACFKHDMVYRDFKDLNRKTAADKVLCDKVFIIAKNLRYDGCQHGLPSMVYKLFDKKTSGSGIKNEIISNKQLAEELNKPVIRKFNKRKVHSYFIDNIWGVDLSDMQQISKCSGGFRV